MDSEYVLLSSDTRRYCEHELLQAQLEALKSVKRLDNYKKCRLEELNLKIKFKSKTDELLSLISSFEKMFPKTEYKPQIEFKEQQMVEKKKKVLSIEEEIDEIQNKLSQLRV
ncbi:MAG: hypothetical protein Q7S74_05105 [Nanoarchaeota archaeon]|nr:hypothetical protein [Nanoarchaeota archaeon]